MDTLPSRPLLDLFLPAYDFNEVHATTVRAAPDAIFTAIKEVRLQELPMFRFFFALRALPACAQGRTLPHFDLNEPLFRWACRSGFLVLAEVPERELVLGAIGQPSRLGGGLSPMIRGGQEFNAFGEPGYVKIAANFQLEQTAPGGVRLSTETRIWAPDPATRVRFARYWRWVRPGSGLIRREWLRSIKRRAERPLAGAA